MDRVFVCLSPVSGPCCCYCLWPPRSRTYVVYSITTFELVERKTVALWSNVSPLLGARSNVKRSDWLRSSRSVWFECSRACGCLLCLMCACLEGLVLFCRQNYIMHCSEDLRLSIVPTSEKTRLSGAAVSELRLTHKRPPLFSLTEQS